MHQSSGRWFILLLGGACACSSPVEAPPPPPACVPPLEVGGDGHPDVLGAKAAGEARAGRITDTSLIPQPAHGRQQHQAGDILMANQHIAVVIEDAGLSDGYARFGGEILSIDRVGEDGRPLGQSTYVETLYTMSLRMPEATSVTVLADGSDGGDAIVRVVGEPNFVPFAEDAFGALFSAEYDAEVAYDYVLAPDAESVVLRVTAANRSPDRADLGDDHPGTEELIGFFQQNHNSLVTPELGFTAVGETAWLGFVGPHASFAFRSLEGPLEKGLEVSGFNLYFAPGYSFDGCATTSHDRLEIIAGGRGFDGLRAAVRSVDGDDSWRSLTGTVRDADGNAMAGVFVHELDSDEVYLSRTQTDENGQFTLHAPDEPVMLRAQARGYQHDFVDVPVGTETVDLEFAPHATIAVTANDADSAAALPVRVQVIPTEPQPATPEAYGVLDEVQGRLHQHFALTGQASLPVPPGEHRIIVSRGYEYELHDETVTVAAGETATITASLERSVDSTGVMCADFHIHSQQSADSSDKLHDKVAAAIADGLDIPVSSEHEWVVDFDPIVQDLGMEDWAFGMASSELTTFSYGHMGVVPLVPTADLVNNGAIEWLDRTPAETFAEVDLRPEQPALIINHPTGSAIGAYFDTVGLLDDGSQLNPELWSDNFDAIEVFNSDSYDDVRNSVVVDWFKLLNAGLRRSAVGSSDSHSLRTKPSGYPRTCFDLGIDDPRQVEPSMIRDGLVAGSSTISGGILLQLEGAQPGDEVAAGTLALTVDVQAPSWVQASQLEIIVSGNTVDTVALEPAASSGAGQHFRNDVEVSLSSGQWVIFHVRGAGDLSPLHPGREPFAVANPIYAL